MNIQQRPILKNIEDFQRFLVSQLRMANHPVTFFVGAGVSTPSPSCLPSVASIITHVINALCIEPEVNTYQSNLPKRALAAGMKMEGLFEIIHHNGNSLNSLFSMFENDKPNLYHYFLSRLIEANLVKHIVTTNFDSLIEKASRVNLNVLADDSEHAIRKNRSIYKIHGTVDKTETIIAVLPQVTHGLGPNKIKLLKETLDNTCVVLGWSDNDIDLTPSFFEAEKGKLIWFKYAKSNQRSVVDFQVTPEPQDIPEIDPRIQQILKKNSGVLVVCDPMSFLLDVWRDLEGELGSIPTLNTKVSTDIVSITRDWGKSLTTIDRLMIVGDILRYIACWSEAINLFQQVEKQLTIPDQLYYVHYRLGTCSINLSNWQEAFQYLHLALKDKGYHPSIETLLCNYPKDPQLAPLYGNMGCLLKEIDRGQDAEKCFKMDFELCEQYGLEGKSKAYTNYANILIFQGKVEEAKRLACDGIRIGKQEGNILAIGQGYSILAEVEGMKGNWDKAEDNLRKALEICEMIGRPDLKVSTLIDLAHLAFTREKFDIAHRHADKALGIAESYNLYYEQALVWMTVGIIHKEEGAHNLFVSHPSKDSHFKHSFEAYSKALGLTGAVSSRDKLKSMILTNRGLLYYFQEDYENAFRDLWESLQIRTQLLDDIGRANILDNLALVFLQGGMVNEAEEFLNEAFSIYERFNHTAGKCQILNDLGAVYATKLNISIKMCDVNRVELKDFYQKAWEFYMKSLEMATLLSIQNKIKQAKYNLEMLNKLNQKIYLDK